MFRVSSPKMLPPRLDLKNKPKTHKGKGENAPLPSHLKPKAITAEADVAVNAVDKFLSEDVEQIIPEKVKVTRKVRKQLPRARETVTKTREISQDKPVVTKDRKENYVTLAFNSNDWIFTQSTAISSVIIDENGLIDPETAKYVNDNGNCWDDKDLVKYYRTFVGAHNFKNHNSDSGKGTEAMRKSERVKNSYGVVIDARLRPIRVGDSNKVIHYVDLLIATNKALHPDFCKQIERNEIRFTSMGCESSACRCTKCGKVFTKEEDICEHIVYERGFYFMKKGGKKYRIAEQVVDEPNEQGMRFINFYEISYLTENPAFKGAAKSHVLNIPEGQDFVVTLPKKYWEKEAFQAWKDYIKVKEAK